MCLDTQHGAGRSCSCCFHNHPYPEKSSQWSLTHTLMYQGPSLDARFGCPLLVSALGFSYYLPDTPSGCLLAGGRSGYPVRVSHDTLAGILSRFANPVLALGVHLEFPLPAPSFLLQAPVTRSECRPPLPAPGFPFRAVGTGFALTLRSFNLSAQHCYPIQVCTTSARSGYLPPGSCSRRVLFG